MERGSTIGLDGPGRAGTTGNTQTGRLRTRGRQIVGIVRRSIRTFVEHNGLQTGGALAYYALLSLAPLLLIVVSLASIFFSDDTVRVELVAQIERLIGRDGAGLAEMVLSNAANEGEDQLSLTIGTVLLLVGASTVFAQLQSALNRVWGVEAAPERAWLGFLRHRLLSLALVLTIGFLLLVSLSFDAMLAAIQDVLGREAGETWILIAVNRLSTFMLATVLLVLILKYLPDADVKWRNVWLGALTTTVLFGNRFQRVCVIAVSLAFVTGPALAQEKAVPAHGIDPAIGHDQPLEALSLHSDLEDFVKAVKAAGLADALTDGTEYTIFAPTNRALDDEGFDSLMRPENRDALVDLLHGHIVADDVDWAAARHYGTTTTINGRTISLAIDGDRLRVADTTTADSSVVVGKLRVYPIDAVLSGGAPTADRAPRRRRCDVEPR